MKEELEPQQEEQKRELPTGIGGKELKKGREMLPVIEVDNEVEWVNPAFERTMPFDLKRYERADLGMFLTPEDIKLEPNKRLEVKKLHGRSAILGRVIFKDREGRPYRDIDIKGIGHSELSGKVVGKIAPRGILNEQTQEAHGILDLPAARQNDQMAERFLEFGIRTYRSIARIRLKEIVDEKGNKISIEEAKEREMILESITPVLSVRAFGTRARIMDIKYSRDRTLLVKDAKRLVAAELGFNMETFDDKQYAEWFAKTLGKNVARMHKNGFVHGYITGHNITLDCRIVDLDSVKETTKMSRSEKENLEKNDIDFAVNTTRVLDPYAPQKYFDYFKQAYEEEIAK